MVQCETRGTVNREISLDGEDLLPLIGRLCVLSAEMFQQKLTGNTLWRR